MSMAPPGAGISPTIPLDEDPLCDSVVSQAFLQTTLFSFDFYIYICYTANMFKLNNKSIVFGLSLIAVLALGTAITPAETSASMPGYSDAYNSPNPNPVYYYYQVPVYVETPAPAPAPTPTVYSSATNPNAPKVAPKAVAKAKTDETKTAEVAKKDEVTNKYGDLLAGVIFGTDGFLPSGLTGWTFFAILILGTVILARKVFGGSEKYYATPMKHK